nr:putative Zinc finger, BED-type [Ipomoea batatas]
MGDQTPPMIWRGDRDKARSVQMLCILSQKKNSNSAVWALHCEFVAFVPTLSVAGYSGNFSNKIVNLLYLCYKGAKAVKVLLGKMVRKGHMRRVVGVLSHSKLQKIGVRRSAITNTETIEEAEVGVSGKDLSFSCSLALYPPLDTVIAILQIFTLTSFEFYLLIVKTCMRRWILQDAVKEMQEYVSDIKSVWATTGCSILLDGWVDSKGRKLVNALVYCPSSPWSIFTISNQIAYIRTLHQTARRAIQRP